MYTFEIKTDVDSFWDKNLLKNNSGNFFQSSDYLNSDSKNYFPIFIYVLDESKNIVGQIGISIINTSVLYSSTIFQTMLKLIKTITTRGVWLFGPIIFSDDKNEKIKILQKIIEGIDIVCKKYNLVFIEGHTSPYEQINEDYLYQLSKNNYILSKHVTFISDLLKPIEQIWKDVSKKTRGDVLRAERRDIVVKEIKTIDELKKFLLLHKDWASTKGLDISEPLKNQEKLWNNHKIGVEKFFLAYQSGKLISGLRISCFNELHILIL